MNYRIYTRQPQEASPSDPAVPQGVAFQLWTPSLMGWRPTDLPRFPFAAWSLLHFLRVFPLRSYGAILFLVDQKPVHYTCILPKYFRFPFMAARDLQIGPTWTHPDYRGRGLGSSAIAKVFHDFHAKERCFWYLARSNNEASIKTAEKAGLRWVGTAERKKRLGSRLLGYFDMTPLDQVAGAPGP